MCIQHIYIYTYTHTHIYKQYFTANFLHLLESESICSYCDVNWRACLCLTMLQKLPMLLAMLNTKTNIPNSLPTSAYNLSSDQHKSKQTSPKCRELMSKEGQILLTFSKFDL